MLIEKGADLNVVNEDNDSALIIAADNGKISNIFNYRKIIEFAVK